MGEKKNSERIRKAYEECGLTYKSLASLTGLKVNSLACWITARRNPPDYVADMIVEKVRNFMNGGGEYINKKQSRDAFVEAVYEVFSKTPPSKQPTEIMKAYDNLPTVSFNENKKKNDNKI